MAYWLFKSEPNAWSWADQVKEGKGGGNIDAEPFARIVGGIGMRLAHDLNDADDALLIDRMRSAPSAPFSSRPSGKPCATQRL